jgi:hypothetical protein
MDMRSMRTATPLPTIPIEFQSAAGDISMMRFPS